MFDEGSAVSDEIYHVAEGGLTDGAPRIFIFGNPTRRTGKLYWAVFGSERDRWNDRLIDGREVMRKGCSGMVIARRRDGFAKSP